MYRKIIDGLVIVLLLIVLTPYALEYFPVEYDDTILPDEVRLLDEKISEKFAKIDGGFDQLLSDSAVRKEHVLKRSVNPTSLDSSDIYKQSVGSSVYISIVGTDGYEYFGSGSVLTKDGLILTNYHVIEDSDKVLVVFENGDMYEVQYVPAFHEALDVAFLKINAENLTPLPIGDSDNIQIGEETYVIGNSEGFINSYSSGVVSGIRDYTSTGEGVLIQITNPTSGGNSGGALLNKYGELIGIPTSALEYDNNTIQVQNINFAIPINAALKLLETKIFRN